MVYCVVLFRINLIDLAFLLIGAIFQQQFNGFIPADLPAGFIFFSYGKVIFYYLKVLRINLFLFHIEFSIESNLIAS